MGGFILEDGLDPTSCKIGGSGERQENVFGSVLDICCQSYTQASDKRNLWPELITKPFFGCALFVPQRKEVEFHTEKSDLVVAFKDI